MQAGSLGVKGRFHDLGSAAIPSFVAARCAISSLSNVFQFTSALRKYGNCLLNSYDLFALRGALLAMVKSIFEIF